MSDAVLEPWQTDTPTLIGALRVLAVTIESVDGVPNAALGEAAQRLEELSALVIEMAPSLRHRVALPGDCPDCRLMERVRALTEEKPGGRHERSE